MYSLRVSPRPNADNSKWVVDSSDVATDCSDNTSNVALDLESIEEVYAEIDEENDDLFYAISKRSLTVVGGPKQLEADGLGDSHVDHVEIDGEDDDDDAFYSTHRQPRLGSALQSVPSSQETIISQDVCCDSEKTEISDIQPSPKYSEIVSKASLDTNPGAEQRASLCGQASPGGGESDSGGSQFKSRLLDDLRGSRTGGVRKHLERKLAQEVTS